MNTTQGAPGGIGAAASATPTSRRCVLLCLLLATAFQLLAVFRGTGYVSPDEHFQILEFANWRLGLSPAEDLPWEFARQMRPSLQPALAVAIHGVAGAFGTDDPFVLATWMRLLSAALGLGVSLLLCRQVSRTLRSAGLVRFLLFMTCFLWPVAYVRARFSSENWSGALLVGGLLLLLSGLDRGRSRRATIYGLAAGFVFALSFFCRFQIGLSLAGIGLWLVLVRRPPLRYILQIALGAAAGLLMNLVLDRWFYGEWVLTPWRYYEANLVEDRAGGFGREPWSFYPLGILLALVPPFSLVFAAALIMAVVRRSRNVLVWAAVPFFAGHMLIAHKETRFLLPLLYLVPALICIGLDTMTSRALTAVRVSRGGRMAIWAFVVIDLGLLFGASVRPMASIVVLQAWIRDEAQSGVVTLWSWEGDPYEHVGLRMNFYASPSVRTRRFPGVAELAAAFKEHEAPVLVVLKNSMVPDELRQADLEWDLRFRTAPAWLLDASFAALGKRIGHWSVYRLSHRR